MHLSHQFFIGFGIGVELIALSTLVVALIIRAHRLPTTATKQ